MLEGGSPPTIRVVVIDERTVVREGVRVILGADPTFDVIATVAQLDAGIAVARATRPNVVMVELPPGIARGQLVRSLGEDLPDSSVVMLTDLAEGDAIAEALREGAVAYVVKDAQADEVRSTIRSAGLRSAGLRSPSRKPVVPEVPGKDVATLLTRREQDVLARIAEGKPNRVIARELGISSETVKTYVKRVLGKLEVESRTEAAVLALTTGMVQAAPAAAAQRGPTVAPAPGDDLR